MTDDAVSIFDEHAAEYEALRRRLVPCFDAFYGAAVQALDLLGRSPRRVLDLGAGTGLLARAIARAHPRAELVLLDGSPAMLAQARAALGDRASYVTSDLRDALPAGPFEAVVSALAIHHLEDRDKHALFARVLAELAPGGLFVNAEQIKARTPELGREHAEWHERRARALGASAAEWTEARERMGADRLAGVSEQLQWLRASGFADVECVFRDHGFAVLLARRALASLSVGDAMHLPIRRDDSPRVHERR